MANSACPYCDEIITLKPDQEQKCPRCRQEVFVRSGQFLTEFEALRHDEQKAAEKVPQVAQSKDERLKLFREITERGFRNVQDPHMIDVFPVIMLLATQDGHSCPHCLAIHKKLIPTKECTLAMLPPFHNCTNKEDGCRCTFMPISKWRYAKMSRPESNP